MPPQQAHSISRMRAFFIFVLALIYFYFAEMVAAFAARGFTSDPLGLEFIGSVLTLFLLLAGYAGMGYAFQRQTRPLSAMGLVRRPGRLREFGLGAAVGWGLVVACVLPVVLFAGYRLTFWTNAAQYRVLAIDLLTLLFAALLEEIVFRGYPFQRLMDAFGTTAATLLMAPVFALFHLNNPEWTPMSMVVTILSGWLFTIAYLRTRALWLPWGLHFGWNVALGVVFGLPISGHAEFSPIVQSSTAGPIWITGGGYGPEGSLIAALVLIGGMFVLYRVTRGYAHLYAQPVIIPAGIPVDIDAAARRQHETAMATPAAPAGPTLVQIAPAQSMPVEFTGVPGPTQAPASEASEAMWSEDAEHPPSTSHDE